MQAEIRALQNDVQKAETTNKELLDYIELMQRSQQDLTRERAFLRQRKSQEL